MMCDTSPGTDPAESPPEPPPIAASSQQQQSVQHQHQQQQQQQRQQYRQPEDRGSPQWSSSTSPASPSPHPRPGSVGVKNNQGSDGDIATDAVGSAAASGRSAGPDSSNTFSQQSGGYQVASTWHRSESAPNLQVSGSHGGVRALQQQQKQQQRSCRIHAMHTPGCRDCQGIIRSSTPVLIGRSSTNPASSTGGGEGMTTSSLANGSPIRRHSSVPVPQNPSTFGAGGNGHSSGSGDLDAAGYLGQGKRVWDERGTSKPSSSCGSAGGSAPTNAYFFPSAAAAAAAAAATAAAAAVTSSGRAGGSPSSSSSSRQHLKRRISADAADVGIEGERASPALRGSSSSGVDSSAAAVAAKGNDCGNGSDGGAYINGSSLDAATLSSELTGMGTPAPLSDDGFSRGSNGGSGGGGGGRSRGSGSGGGQGGGGRGASTSGSDMEKLVLNVATKGMQQALQYGLRHTFTQIIQKKVRYSGLASGR